MRINLRTTYAIYIIVDIITNQSGDKLIRAKDIAQRQLIPMKYVMQILLSLKNNGVLESFRGRQGGYKLAVETNKLSMAEIVRIMDPITIDNTMPNKSCKYTETTITINKIWMEVKNKILRELQEATFDKICSYIKTQEKNVLNYSI
mgnify:CR=1 FL=1